MISLSPSPTTLGFAAVGGLSLLLLACGAEVEVPSDAQRGVGGTAETATTTATVTTTTGGCAADCVSCCNPAHCAPLEPSVGDPCVHASGQIKCGYVRDDGCLQYYFCNPPTESWASSGEPVCPGDCVIAQPGAVCLEPGQQCHFPYEGPDGCVHATCDEDHTWQTELEIGAECP